MNILHLLKSYAHYLIHPFATHEAFLHPEREPGFKPMHLNPYESLATSWVFVIINGIFRIFLLNLVVVWLLNLFSDTGIDYTQFINISELPAMYFVVLSTVLDIIFYPLFGIFLIQFWEVVIKFFGSLLNTPGDLSQKAQNIVSVYLSSNVLRIIPIVGDPIQSLAAMVLMYAGLRKQLNASPLLSVCIILSPLLLLFGLVSLVLLLIILMA